MKISVVIPVFRGEDILYQLFNRIISVFQNTEYQIEVIFVFDCGNKNSWNIIEDIVVNNRNIAKGIHLSRNYGQHNALICGFEIASGEFVVTIDEDLQQDPIDILRLLDKQKEENFDVVYGKFKSLKHNFFRNTTSGILKKLLRLGIPELHPDYSALRLIKIDIAKALIEMQNSYTFLDGYLTWVTTHIDSTKVNHFKRAKGKSSYNVKKLIEHSINIFVTFSKLPIRLLIFFSFSIFILTIIYTGVIAYQKIVGEISVPGYASLIITIGLGVGFILLGLGIIGEYIYRINLKTTKRPNYKIKKIL